jgi:16S rRNA (guanine(966)-N(2))-methyltransferase RsmD
MRVVAGDLGGRVLRAPHGAATRPTSEKVREAVFAILPDVAGARVLDVFAGSGAVGIEALSRGAAHATFVDSGRAALAAVRANLAALGVPADRATVHAGDAVGFARAAGGPFELVFVDPPYASDLAVRVATALPAAALAAGATVVVEHDRRHAPPDDLGDLRRVDQRRYGDTLVSFYRARSEGLR